MGDIADDHYDQMIEDMCTNGYGFFGGHRRIYRQPQCNRCGSYAVFWLPQDGRKYQLTNTNGTPHFCNPANPDDFEDLTNA